MATIESLKKEIAKLKKQKAKYEKEHSVKNIRAEYVGCRKCGSRLKTSLLSGENCPLCRTDLKSKAVAEKISEFNTKIRNLSNEVIKLEENVLRRTKGTFDLDSSIEPDKESDKKILEYLKNKYGEEFRYAECCESKDFIFVSSKDYIHAKNYFSAWFDAYLFDKQGNLIYCQPKYIEGTSYSSFYIDKIEFANDVFKIILRSYIHSYSKCDDEFLAVWTLKFDENYKRYVIEKNPFVFNERNSENYITISDEKFTNDNGSYVVYSDKRAYSTLELSESWSLRKKLEDELRGL